MIENLSEYLIGVAAGIRFRANFSIEDQLGKILDTILYAQDSYFNPKVFPRVANNVGQRIMYNSATDDKLSIDNSNFILEIQFGSKDGFNSSEYDEILKNFNDQIIQGVMSEFKIQQIIRIGLVNRYLFPLDDLAQSFVDKTIGETLEGVNDINLSFSKKMPVPEAFVKRDVNDYCNAIFNIIKKSDLDEIFMSIDYQLCYSPPLEKASHIKFAPFMDSAQSFVTNQYLPWLNTNYVEV
ncbi:hypothetical protein [Desulfobacter postgatei]|uniref:TIGR04255 family protein n=1 Tax=Desulfobacter postgatei 2ac9 TaxID=879212 RepID=I5B756_9BACT|nr:hypothetical protein [Desulfobacter postgatei]EIM65319.1 hypothetical protein DespoDRAFT_03563 [Desulfobacter postgatei 2ac9]